MFRVLKNKTVFSITSHNTHTTRTYNTPLLSMPTTFDFTTLLGETLTAKSGPVKTNLALENKTGVMIYFSAHWCPPCRGFTPELVTFYKTNKEKCNLEIVFASSDRDEESFNKYYSEMPFLGEWFICSPSEASQSNTTICFWF